MAYHFFHPRSSAERMRVSEIRDAGATPAGDIRSRGVTDSCMPPCEGGGSRCKSSRERHFRFLRGRGKQCTPLVKETMPGQRRPEDPISQGGRRCGRSSRVRVSGCEPEETLGAAPRCPTILIPPKRWKRRTPLVSARDRCYSGWRIVAP